MGSLKASLTEHGITEGLQGLMNLAKEIGKKYGVEVLPTCDAKYLEVGTTSKSDNVDSIFSLISQESGILPEECTYWGDEYVGIEKGIFGSDSFMKTEKTAKGDFFDVSRIASLFLMSVLHGNFLHVLLKNPENKGILKENMCRVYRE